MASLFIVGVADIDYSVVSGEVRSFELRGVVLLDRAAGIALPTWRAELCALVYEMGLGQDDGRGLHAFVPQLLQDVPAGTH